MNFSHFIRLAALHVCAVCLLCLLAWPVVAQELQSGQTSDTSENQPWQPPDIANLPLQWWDSVETNSPDEFQQRMARFGDALQQKFQGLSGEDKVAAQLLLNGLEEQAGLVVLALHGLDSPSFEPVQTRDVYTLDELLTLRRQWRDIQGQQQIPELRLEELKSRASLLQQRQDSLLSQYNAAEENSPSRILLGLRRVAARLDHHLNTKGLHYQESVLAQLRQQGDLLEDQQAYARARLEGGETDWQAIENEAAAAHAELDASVSKVASLQHQLVEVLSADKPKPSLELLRRQQLTRAVASQSFGHVQDNLNAARINWYRFRSGMLDPAFSISDSINQAEELLQETGHQIDIWIATSQTTLITPLPDSSLNARKNVELAHAEAQTTLSIIQKIQGSSDDLRLVQEIFASDLVNSESLFRNIGTRLTLFSSGVWISMKNVLDYDLFHIGDAPVTPGSIINMLLIMVFGYLLSWVIRHLLDRLSNAQRYAKGSVTYTMGRVLHYIIILVSFFVALSTIGLDFTNFALIAGALSVGIGFGLQGIVNNFVSGLILLFEGPLRVGDYIELDSELRGTVKEINTRATVITTNDSVDVIVPNSELVSTRLTNWTLREPVARLRIGFGVAYGSDKEEVKAAALEAAAEVDFIMRHNPGREAQVWLTGFGDSSLDFQLLAWVSKAGVRRPGRTRAQFLWALETKLTERGIEIPFPQRDLHLRTGFDQLSDGEDLQITTDKEDT